MDVHILSWLHSFVSVRISTNVVLLHNIYKPSDIYLKQQGIAEFKLYEYRNSRHNTLTYKRLNTVKFRK
ncbi:hypothetical protein N9J07_03905 [Bacteroidia bacterium]|nr:hypothetical protein [Bacteroidia bacterium]